MNLCRKVLSLLLASLLAPSLALFLALSFCASAQAAQTTIYAAASLTNAIGDLIDAYQHKTGAQVQSSFASSSTLARQIAAGAPADIYASANEKWMTWLVDKGLVEKNAPLDLLGNSLVLIAPAGHPLKVAMKKGRVPDFKGHLCMGMPDSVPAGIYGKQALINLGWWPALKGRVVATQDVRSALAFVARGECPLGIVYETDTAIDKRVAIVGRFPDDSHTPIVYPFTLLPGASGTARGFFTFLRSPEGQAVFRHYGFTVFKH